MNLFSIFDTPIADLKVIKRQPRRDSRGFFSRLFCNQDLALAGWRKPIAQINQTLTQKKGTVRGLHFQIAPHAEMKLVNCVRGVVWDVAVDLRADSPTFLHWHAIELSESNNCALLIPEGFAHGFQTLCNDCELIYFHSVHYASGSENGVNPRDSVLSIAWPLAIAEMSARDALHPHIDPNFKGLTL